MPIHQPECHLTAMQLPASKPRNLPAADKPKTLRSGRKLAAAIDLMVFEGIAFDVAAQSVGCTTRAIRKAFEKPHVLAHIRKRKEVLRAAISSKNIIRLGQIRDAADNMPAVNAIKALEDLGSEASGIRGGAATSPGIVIRIMAGNAAQVESAPVTIDAVANEDETD